MKAILTTTCTAALLCAGVLGAADQSAKNDANASKEVIQDTKTITNNRTTKTSTDTVYGRVESYELHKSIKVSAPGTVIPSKSFDLNDKNEAVNVSPDVKVGEWVSVQEKTDNDGHKTLTVERATERSSR